VQLIPPNSCNSRSLGKVSPTPADYFSRALAFSRMAADGLASEQNRSKFLRNWYDACAKLSLYGFVDGIETNDQSSWYHVVLGYFELSK